MMLCVFARFIIRYNKYKPHATCMHHTHAYYTFRLCGYAQSLNQADVSIIMIDQIIAHTYMSI